MPTLPNIPMLSFWIFFLVLFIGYVVFVPRRSEPITISADAKGVHENPILRTLMSIGSEVSTLLPETDVSSGRKAKNYPKIEDLLQRSGNPWSITAEDFIFMRYVFLFFGLAAGTFVGLIVNTTANFPIPAFTLFFGVLGYFYPGTKHKDLAEKRDLEYKRNLPEALDLILLAMSGTSFETGLRNAIPNMKESLLKNDMIEIQRHIDSGTTTEEALKEFAKYSPNQGVTSFVNAVIEAIRSSSPMEKVLKARAEASRVEYTNLIKEYIAKLKIKLTLIGIPTFIPGVFIILLAPAIAVMIDTVANT